MSSTLVPDFPNFPYIDPPAAQSFAIPLSKRRKTRLTERRNLFHETTDLSEEEEEVDELLRAIKDRGQEFYIPLGRTSTANEERADANLDSASSSEASMSAAGGSDAEGENGGDAGSMDDDDSEEGSEDEDGEDEEMDDDDEDGSDDDEDGEDGEDDDDDEQDLDASMEDLDNSRYNESSGFDDDRFPVDPRQLPIE